LKHGSSGEIREGEPAVEPKMTGKCMNLLARSAWICCLAIVAAFAAASNIGAAEFPTRPIKLVIPYAAGGPTDIFGRLLAEYLGKDLKQAVVVENKGGAQGAIGADMVAHAEPDGYTLLGTSGSVIILNPLLYKKLSYDPAKELRMIALVTEVPVVLCVNPSVPAKTVAEFVAYAKQNPGKLNFGSSGTGSFTHLAAEMFKQMAGVEMTHIAYKGANPALTDVISGNIQLMFESVSLSLPPVRSGMLRPLGISSAQRHADLPDVPTIAESGYPAYSVSVWNGVAVPTGLPDDISRILSDSLQRVMNDTAFRASLEKVGYTALRPRSTAAIAEFMDAERIKWSGVIKAQNISLD
jgi:tripartite-type tricarboxylate transporter receptor subunit TctC